MTDKPITYEEDDRIIYRASALGMGLQALVASRLGYEPLEPDEDQLRRFADGHVHEEAVISQLRTEGWEITGEQEEVELHIMGKIWVRGHIDGKRRSPDRPELTAFDVKSMATDSYDKWIKDRFDVGGYVAGYAQQLGIYGKALDLPVELIAKNKNNGKIDVYRLTSDDFVWSDLVRKIAKVEAYARQGNIDVECNDDWFCPYRWMHPDKEAQNEIIVEPTEEIETAMADYIRAKTALDKADAEKINARTKLDALLPSVARVKSALGTINKTQSLGRKTLDTAELVSTHPEIKIDKFMKPGKPYSTITVTPTRKKK